MTRYIEIGRAAYPLRFTARALLRARARTGEGMEALFHTNARCVCALLHCALTDALPRLSLQGAEALLERYLQAGGGAGDIACALADAYADSGFSPRGVTAGEAEALVSAARRAGLPRPESLLDMTLREMEDALSSFEAQTARCLGLLDALAYMQGAYTLRAARAPGAYPPSPCMTRKERDMTPGEMRNALLAFARRYAHGDA